MGGAPVHSGGVSFAERRSETKFRTNKMASQYTSPNRAFRREQKAFVASCKIVRFIEAKRAMWKYRAFRRGEMPVLQHDIVKKGALRANSSVDFEPHFLKL